MVEYMKNTRPVLPIEPNIHFPLVSIVAEGDMVVVATVSYASDGVGKAKHYNGTHFDMFRVSGKKIVEHWDSMPRDPAVLHTNPNEANRP
ncbi:hypothetical protein BH09PSE4_BH09PSE4_17010 [soil metagenome]